VVFERFTGSSREAVVRAQEASRELGHDWVGCEHLLLGLVEDEGAAGQVLAGVGLTTKEATAEIVRLVGRREGTTEEQAPFTPRAKRVLERSLREALELDSPQINTGHLLLALVSETDGAHCTVLRRFGVDPAAVRRHALRIERDPDYGVAVGRTMTERSLMQASAWLAAAAAPERVIQAIAGAANANAARGRVAALLGMEGWLAEFIVGEPLIHFSPERVAEMRERKRVCLERLEALYGPEAADPFRES
jgi:ATP-dependent Clp protease ATP-binding subunit ClpA